MSITNLKPNHHPATIEVEDNKHSSHHVVPQLFKAGCEQIRGNNFHWKFIHMDSDNGTGRIDEQGQHLLDGSVSVDESQESGRRNLFHFVCFPVVLLICKTLLKHCAIRYTKEI